jgi:hypothetical protein
MSIVAEEGAGVQVTVIGRSRAGINDARLREIFVDDIIDYCALADALENQDTALYCLSLWKAGSFKKTTNDISIVGLGKDVTLIRHKAKQ